MTKYLLLSIVLVVFLFPALSHADSISCDGGIVSNGDSAVNLIMKCGQPQWKESHQEESTEEFKPNLKQRTYITVEEWTYNLGPQQFMRIVTLRNGVVSAIRTGEYGTPKDRRSPGPSCGDRVLSVGDTKADILIKCGEPFHKSSHREEQKERFDDSRSRKVIITVEEWTYNFGPQQFMRIITFRNSKVVDIRTGDYGR